MNFLRKTFAGISIRAASAACGITVKTINIVDFECIEMFLVALAAIILVLSVYNEKFKKIFPYALLIKSGFDAVYILSSSDFSLAKGLIVAVNVVFAMVFICDYLMKKKMLDDKCSKFASISFTACFLIPYIAVFVSLIMIIAAIIFYEISAALLVVCLFANACIFFKVCSIFINLLLLTINN